ncbi:MAG TPA: 23S rRNA (guanosine(2251)-2'-O)-methyltransferase RlmB [Candidatus Polarisedimenticolia bacterium]|jgi:23S rRNA (guanosine2251-2'-O)-methyltransferase|nr:23S rRNA (guanosine(2251)-2'-O)-methyltransferase RlmB [Candidatus Polarisedimenticolia bacterium]
MKGWIHGLHAVEEAIAAAPGRITRVVVAAGRDDGPVRRLLDAARSAGVTIERRPLHEVERLAGQKTVHQGVIALLAETAEADPEALLNSAPAPALFVVLDGVEDPHNLGAVVRSAAAAGASAVFLPEHRSAGLTPASVKASAGAALRIPVVRTGNLAAFLRRLKEKGIWVVGLDPSGEPLWTGFDLKQPVALVLGGEEKGLRRLTREHCDALLALPLVGGVESLNVSVAAGIALYEVVRQRREGS